MIHADTLEHEDIPIVSATVTVNTDTGEVYLKDIVLRADYEHMLIEQTREYYRDQETERQIEDYRNKRDEHIKLNDWETA